MSLPENPVSSTFNPASLNVDSTVESILDEYQKNDKNYKEAMLSALISTITEIISSSEIDSFRKFFQFLIDILNFEKKRNPKKFHANIREKIKNDNFIILACKYNKSFLLTLIMANNHQIYCSCCPPGEKDKQHHNAFYYAIRENSEDNIQLLLGQWQEYVNSEELYKALAEGYEEASLRNLNLSNKLVIDIADRLIDHHFYSDDLKDREIVISVEHIRERVNLLIGNINSFVDEYSKSSDFDDKLMLRSKFIVYNISILKHQMKSTYSEIFWEEMEFYLLAFVASKQKVRIINMSLYKFLMQKSKLFKYLKLFAKVVEKETKKINDQNLKTLANYPRESRLKMVPKIIQSNPEYKVFYEDYQRLKDIYALQLISQSLDVSLKPPLDSNDNIYSDLKHEEIAIKRSLQIITEMMKNTWESPNMSKSLSLLFLMSLPSRTQQIIVNFHNSSCLHTQIRKLDKADSYDFNAETIYQGIRDDLKIIKWLSKSILHVTLINYVTVMLETIIEIETASDLKNYILSFDLDFQTKWFVGFQIDLESNCEILSSKLVDIIGDITTVERSVLAFVLQRVESKELNAKDRFSSDPELKHFRAICKRINDNDKDLSDYTFLKLKKAAKNALKNKYDKKELEIGPYSVFANLVTTMLHVGPCLRLRDYVDASLAMNRLFIAMGHGLQKYEWLEILRTRLWTSRQVSTLQLDNTIGVQEKKKLSKQDDNDYKSKVQALKNIFADEECVENLKKHKKTRTHAAVEMLTLELMSINDASNNLVDNNMFLDTSTPVAVGKALFNYLRHSKTFNIQEFDANLIIFSNAKKLSSTSDESNESNEKNIGKIYKHNIKELKSKYSHNLACVIHQYKMFEAVEQGDFNKLKDAINNGADINGRDYRKRSTLHFAAKGGHVDMFEHLINLKVDHQFRDINGESPLHFATKYGQIKIIKWMITNQIYLEDEDHFKSTPLSFAVRFGYKKIVKLLLLQSNRYSHEALVKWAVYNNDKDITEILLKHKNKPLDSYQFPDQKSLMHLVAENGYPEFTEYLIGIKANIHTVAVDKTTPLHKAAEYGNLKTVKLLLLNRANINARSISGATPLHEAVKNKHEEVVKVLLENGANVHKVCDAKHYTALHLAAKKGSFNMVELLVKYKADVNATTNHHETPLHFAAEGGYYDIANFLIQKKAQVKVEDTNRNTPVHCAAKSGNSELVGLLLRKGGKVGGKNIETQNPLFIAASKGHLEVIKLLMERGANFKDSSTSNGVTPLHASILDNRVKVVKYFIRKKVELNDKTTQDATPLSFAAFNGFFHIVKDLVEAGCDLYDNSPSDMAPLHLAIMRNYGEIVEYFLSKNINILQPTTNRMLPIHIAVEYNLFNIVADLLKMNPDTLHAQDCLNRTPLYVVCQWNYPQLVQFLISKGAQIIYDGMHCMDPALRSGSREVVDVLLKNGIDVHGSLPHGIPFLHRAVQYENIDVVKFLITKKVNLNVVSTASETALMIAAAHDYLDVTYILLKNNADPWLKNDNNYTALDFSIVANCFLTFCLLFNYFEAEVRHGAGDKCISLHLGAIYDRECMVTHMITKGFDVSSCYQPGRNPLHTAAACYSGSVVKTLENNKSKGIDSNELTATLLEETKRLFMYIEKGDYSGCLNCLHRKAFVNGKNDDSLSPLHCASGHGFSNIVKLLIDFNADINLVAGDGTPLVLAVLNERYEVVKILLKAGAVYNVVTHFGCGSLADLTENSDIIKLIDLIENAFDAIKKCDTSIVDELKKIKDYDILQCVFNTRNRENKRLHQEAKSSGFPKEKLAEINKYEASLFIEKYTLNKI